MPHRVRRRTFLTGSGLAALAVPALAAGGRVENSAGLVGAWRLVSMVRDAAGGAKPYWDDKPSGLIIYTADGHMAAQLYDTRRPRLGGDLDSVSADAARASFAGLITYFGTYQVDARAGTVTHSVAGAMTPDWIGGKLVRAYRFLTPDRVELRTVTDAAGRRVASSTVLVWERVRPAVP